ncbi:fanconi anemia group F protein (FANCF) isoform X2 [Tasmannia lanceolata]|uniref:fanconi anemia group F protein (FANCF) isoform X2 n=1 Tax=Tasmannia lanceolata TaxID=3420 RepID=UPI004063634B
MGWSYPDISLEDVVNLVKGFVDILILASGYQSSGLPAVWDSENIKKAIQWGIFFENVFTLLQSSDNYHELMKELDAALLELTSNPLFPQGLAHLSSATLARARNFVLGHLLQNMPLRDEHLGSLLTATIEMDLDDLSKSGYDSLSVYIDKLMHQITSLSLSPDGHRDTVIDPKSPLTISNMKTKEHTVEIGLDVLSEIVTREKGVGSGNSLSGEQSCNDISLVRADKFKGYVLWNKWRSSNLSYLLDKRTIRLVSGANLIFSAPKVQWLQVFEPLKVSTEAHNDNLLEIIELSLLGILSSRWSCVIEHLMSVSHDPIPIYKQYYDVHNLLEGKSHPPHSKEKTMDSKDNDILEYLTMLLGTQLHQLWSLAPVLVAAAIPLWSTLFRLYLNEIEKQMERDSSTIRICTCGQDGKEHTDCEIAERIWCLYIFHVRGPNLNLNG